MGNGALAIGPKLPRPSSTLPTLPTLPSSAVQQVGSYLGNTGREIQVVEKATPDPNQPFGAQKGANACHTRGASQVDIAGAIAPSPGPLISKTVPSGQ